jgi:hypothetical protein
MTIQELPAYIMVSELDPTMINKLWIHNSPVDFTLKQIAKIQAKASETYCLQVRWTTVQSAM